MAKFPSSWASQSAAAVLAVVLLTASSCDRDQTPPVVGGPGPAETPPADDSAIPTLNGLVRPVTFTGSEIDGHVAGYSYATLRFDLEGVDAVDENKVARSLGNALRRWLRPEDHAASLVVQVTKNAYDADTGQITEQTIANVPIISLVYTETDEVSETYDLNLGQQLIPWFRVEPGETLRFAYVLRSSRDTTSQVAGKVVELGKTAARLVGQQAGWVLSKLTGPAITSGAEKLDAEIGKAFSVVKQDTTRFELRILSDPDRRKGYTVDLRGDDALPAAKLSVTLAFRQSYHTDRVKSAGRVPDIELSQAAIFDQPFGPARDHTVRELFEGAANRDWYRMWKGQTGAEFVDGCLKAQSLLREAGLANYDLAAAYWAVLTTNHAFMTTPQFHDTYCIDPAMRARLAALGMTIDKPRVEPEARQIAVEEMEGTLNSIIGLMKIRDEEIALQYAPNWMTSMVTVADEEHLTQNFFSVATLPRTDALRMLRKLKPERAGCSVSFGAENGATRTMLVQAAETGKLYAVEAVFDGKATPFPSAPVSALTLRSATVDLLGAVARSRTVRDTTGVPVLGEDGKPRISACNNDWRPWETAENVS